METEEPQSSRQFFEPPGDWEDRIRATPPLMRWLYRCLAGLFLLLAIIGAVLPGMPTTVFVLLAAWAAARSSARMLRWLYRHRLFGPLLYHWYHGRAVSRNVKWTATLMMLFCALILFYVADNIWFAVLPCVIMACVLLWLWYRPEPQMLTIRADQPVIRRECEENRDI